MVDINFADPVTLRLPGNGQRKVATAFEALECLERDWPEWARGRRWRSAIATCRDAIDGWRASTDARRSFVRAAMRAGIVQGAKRAKLRAQTVSAPNVMSAASQ